MLAWGVTMILALELVRKKTEVRMFQLSAVFLKGRVNKFLMACTGRERKIREERLQGFWLKQPKGCSHQLRWGKLWGEQV